MRRPFPKRFAKPADEWANTWFERKMCAPGAGLHLHRRRRGVELSRGALASLPGADIGTAFGDPPGGLPEPLEPDWRGTPVRGPHRPLGRSDPVPGEGEWADTEWAEREYARSMHTDGRVRRRPVEMGKAWQKRLGRPLPEILSGKAEQQAAHRMLSNPGVRMEHIVEPHFESTCGRCRAERFVLAIQDTTTLNYDGLAATGGLDSLGGGGKGSRGLLAHVGMAVNAAGRPLGMFSLDAACPETRVVSVCDREGDFWELLAHARDRQAALPVRASKSARRRVVARDGKIRDLWAHVGQAAPVGGRVIEIPECGGPNRRSGRTVRLTLRCLEVGPLPPKDVGGPPMRMPAVSAREENPPAAVARKGEALDWMPRTTEGEPGPENACTVLRWHQLRWRTGRFLHALKVGTRTGDRKLDEADGPRKCLALNAITAFRVRNLTFLARERPDDPARMYAGPDGIEVLFALAASLGPTPPRGPPDPDVRTFVVLTAGLAGFHPSKRQPVPGNRKLWLGMVALSGGVMGYQAMRDHGRRRMGE